jgi:hypothetical protein
VTVAYTPGNTNRIVCGGIVPDMNTNQTTETKPCHYSEHRSRNETVSLPPSNNTYSAIEESADNQKPLSPEALATADGIGIIVLLCWWHCVIVYISDEKK